MVQRPYAADFFLFRLIPWKVVDSLSDRVSPVGPEELFVLFFSSFFFQAAPNDKCRAQFFRGVQRKGKKEKKKRKNSLENFCTFHSKSVSTKTKTQLDTSSALREIFFVASFFFAKRKKPNTNTSYYLSEPSWYLHHEISQVEKVFSFFLWLQPRRALWSWGNTGKKFLHFHNFFVISWLPSIFTLKQFSSSLSPLSMGHQYSDSVESTRGK